MKSYQVIATLLLVTIALAQARNAYFVFQDGSHKDEFVIKLSDPAKIQHARALLAKTTEDQPRIMGTIIKREAWYNSEWSYELNTTTIRFFDTTAEVCDADIAYVEEHLAEVGTHFLPGNVWCPWQSYLVREL
ncbi:hypothetical protein SAMD00019534_070980 [Acytostelium subglobosum LB1]|uniref:hypothetical protein n=1 Tax=Acytostelium subglobosum LB1 TaxID=1410327 RepID=UPI000644A5BD|nr:hypothetical protein SAMD00019534_070980 [Acytostelium subglobosum LB1]GAM23923.1 hypothetical protein SAMD00019534_070980 [Acytostelium subglobosum LB1]|eukprot:XP_012752959.1 hypothetical protein SAMD00019534_070980 [Acytostelium subglobosum LB1]